MASPLSLSAQVDALLSSANLIEAWRVLNDWERAMPGDPDVVLRQARLLRLRGRHPEAQCLLEGLVATHPLHVDALTDLARLAREMGQITVAITWYEKALIAQPDASAWLGEWIDLLVESRALDRAHQVAQWLCAREPTLADSWFRLGLVQQYARAFPDALQTYERAMAIDPAWPMLRNNLAALHIENRDFERARTLLEDAIREDSGNAFAWTNLATCYLRTHDPEAARVAAERACALAPNYAVAQQTLANVLKELQDWVGARATAERAVQCAPGDPAYLWGLAMLQLIQGDYGRGLLNHEARWQGSPELRNNGHHIPRPQWRGESLTGKVLFVWGEQGFGDAIQFVRFVPALAEIVRASGGRIVYCCFADLVPLFHRSLGPDLGEVIPHDRRPLPDFDYHLPLCSLPLALGVLPDALPHRTSYLKAGPVEVLSWRDRLRQSGKLRVGLVWTGSHSHQRNPLRAVDAGAYADAFGELEDIDFFSLQLQATDDVERMRQAGLPLLDYTPALASFDDTAAFVSNLDLVITVCTSVAHLAGGLGVPTWVLLDVNPHWVWMLERDDSPWYPAARLYRQQRYREWGPVLERVRDDLRLLAQKQASR